MKFRVKHSGPVAVVIHKTILLDPRISPNAKGVLGVLLCMQEKELTITELSRQSKGGTAGIKSAIKELYMAGYIKYKNSTYIINDALGEKVVIPEPEKSTKKTTLDKKDCLFRRIAQRSEFAEVMHDIIKEKEFEMPPSEIKKFYQYWTEIDSINPCKKMPFQDRKSFHILLRLRSWERKWKKDEHLKKTNRL